LRDWDRVRSCQNIANYELVSRHWEVLESREAEALLIPWASKLQYEKEYSFGG